MTFMRAGCSCIAHCFRRGAGLWFPLLARAVSVSARYCTLENLGLAVDWKLEDGDVLKLYANLGEDWLTTAISQPGGQFYSSSPKAANGFAYNQLAPWSVIWLLQACDQG